MKHALFAPLLIAIPISFAALVPLSFGQEEGRSPQVSLNPEISISSPLDSPVRHEQVRAQTPPKYCKPCLFYAGDFDSNASDANGLANEFDLIVSTGAAVYTPFIVPKGKTWTVTGLFTNNFMLGGWVLDPPVIPYEIRKGIPATGGDGGKIVCHGKKHGTLVVVITDYASILASIVDNIKACRLPAGKYWMSVVPYCTNVNDGACTNGYRAFLSNDDGAMTHRYGPLEPANDSFFNSKFYGAHWDPSSKWQTSKRFSVGVEGTEN